MLTRLKVSGFKNLVDVDVRFGAFTCIAGVNGVGKSNLFDAIRFLSALAELPLTEAALSVRDGSGAADIRNLFHRVGDRYVDKMSFEAEMIIPKEGINNLGQKIEASATFLKYSLDLGYEDNKSSRLLGKLKVLKEELVAIGKDDINQYLLFKHQTNNWIKSIFRDREQIYQKIFLSKFDKDNIWQILYFDEDYKNETKTQSELKAGTVETTSLNLFSMIMPVNNIRTLFLARQEMISWQLLQLEPSSLRKPNEFTAPSKLEVHGSNLAASLYDLAGKKYSQEEDNTITEEEREAKIYTQVSNRLSELLDDVDQVWIDRDDGRQLLTLMVKNKDGAVHSARYLSDGTLRFLALTILELDPESLRLLCLEEPENGIHPERIVTILQLLQDVAVDIEEKVDIDNPMRQVIINTHSPLVVQQVPDDSLLFAELKETVVDGQRFKRASFSYLPDTWRDQKDSVDRQSNIISKGELLSYLNPVSPQIQKDRVIDRSDLQSLIPGNKLN